MLNSIIRNPATKMLGKVAVIGAAVEGGRLAFRVAQKGLESLSPETGAVIAGIGEAVGNFLDPLGIFTAETAGADPALALLDREHRSKARAIVEKNKRELKRFREINLSDADRAHKRASVQGPERDAEEARKRSRNMRAWADFGEQLNAASEGAQSGAEALQLAQLGRAVLKQAHTPPRDVQEILDRRDLSTEQKSLMSDLTDSLQRNGSPDFPALVRRVVKGTGGAYEGALVAVAGACCSACASGGGTCASKKSIPANLARGHDEGWDYSAVDDDDDDEAGFATLEFSGATMPVGPGKDISDPGDDFDDEDDDIDY